MGISREDVIRLCLYGAVNKFIVFRVFSILTEAEIEKIIHESRGVR
jgi:hypothetical protein